jgi:hypothetical protein
MKQNSKKKDQHPVIVQKLYDILVWVSPVISKFPKDKRYTVGTRMETLLLEVLETLVEASYSHNKMNLLKKANSDLEKFRFLARLSKDLRFIDLRRFSFLASHVDEVGNMLGGWIRQQSRS